MSCKIHDTLKKTRDLLVASYGVRYPERAAKAKSMGGEIDIDPNVSLIFFSFVILVNREQKVLEGDRQRVLAIERLIVETICFNFNTRLPFPYVIKISRAFGGQ